MYLHERRVFTQNACRLRLKKNYNKNFNKQRVWGNNFQSCKLLKTATGGLGWMWLKAFLNLQVSTSEAGRASCQALLGALEYLSHRQQSDQILTTTAAINRHAFTKERGLMGHMPLSQVPSMPTTQCLPRSEQCTSDQSTCPCSWMALTRDGSSEPKPFTFHWKYFL